MKAIDALKDERFLKYLDQVVKTYIDDAMKNAGMEIPEPKTLSPLFYDNKNIDTSVARIKKGFALFAPAFDLFVERTGEKK